jgi:hypothetical protein
MKTFNGFVGFEAIGLKKNAWLPFQRSGVVIKNCLHNAYGDNGAILIVIQKNNVEFVSKSPIKCLRFT